MTSALEYIFGAYRKVRPFFLADIMKKVLFYILLFTLLSIGSTGVLRAQETTAEGSATVQKGTKHDFDYRVANLENYLESYNSPLSEYSIDFVAYADEYGLDYRMVPAISGVESTFGKRVPKNSYNAYGWANGEYRFTSWEDSIEHVSMTLKTKYIDRGATSITKIARRYAPPSATWASNVKYFVGKIDTLPLTFDI
jgi:hypothetical protein